MAIPTPDMPWLSSAAAHPCPCGHLLHRPGAASNPETTPSGEPYRHLAGAQTLRRIQHHQIALPRQTLSGVSTLTPQQQDLFATLNLPTPTRTRLESLV